MAVDTAMDRAVDMAVDKTKYASREGGVDLFSDMAVDTAMDRALDKIKFSRFALRYCDFFRA